MNTWVGIGRLTRSPEIRTTQTGKKTASYTLAVDRRYGKQTDFIRCVAWDKQADFAEGYLRKGMKIAVVGELHIDERDGKYYTEVKVDLQEFCESKKAETDVNAGNYEDLSDDFELPF